MSFAQNNLAYKDAKDKEKENKIVREGGAFGSAFGGAGAGNMLDAKKDKQDKKDKVEKDGAGGGKMKDPKTEKGEKVLGKQEKNVLDLDGYGGGRGSGEGGDGEDLGGEFEDGGEDGGLGLSRGGIKKKLKEKDVKDKSLKKLKEGKKEKVVKGHDKDGNPVYKKKKQRSAISSLKFDSYIHKILKQVWPDLGITKPAMNVMTDLVANAMEQIMEEARKLCKGSGRETLNARDLQTAVKLVLPGELATHSNDEAFNALRSYNATKPGKGDDALALGNGYGQGSSSSSSSAAAGGYDAYAGYGGGDAEMGEGGDDDEDDDEEGEEGDDMEE